jgi:hypothetical protein
VGPSKIGTCGQSRANGHTGRPEGAGNRDESEISLRPNIETVQCEFELLLDSTRAGVDALVRIASLFQFDTTSQCERDHYIVRRETDPA